MKKRLLSAIFSIILLLMLLQNITLVYASTPSSSFNFKEFENVTGNTTVNTVAKSTMGTAIVVIRTVATGMAIIMLTVIAIKYMMAAPNERADFKKSATVYIVGAVLVFAAGNIFGIIANFTKNNL